MKKFMAGAAIAASLAGGSAVIAATNPLGIAGANAVSVQAGGQDPGTTTGTTPVTAAPTTAPPTTQAPGPSTGGKGADGHPGGKGRGDILGSTLDDLVKDGTITQAQADKIKAKLKEKMGSFGGPRPGMGGFMGKGLDDLAKELGMTADDLKAGFKSGKSIADLAKAKGIDPQKVIDDLVAAATKRIDEGVASGKIPQDRADKMKSSIKDGITKMVNGQFGHGGFEGPGGRPGGPKPSTGTTPTTTK